MNTPAQAPQTISLTSQLTDMPTLLGVAKALLTSVTLSVAEHAVLANVTISSDTKLVSTVSASIQAHNDPLGDAFCIINTPEHRRDSGQTFTPKHVVTGMLEWVKRQGKVISRIVDPGAGTGRYTLASLRAHPGAKAIAIEMDPVVSVILRANLQAAGFGDQVEVVVGDFRDLTLGSVEGVTLFIGNPPYVRHHGISTVWKEWYTRTLKKFGHTGSQLAGLHMHFFLKTLELSVPGDLGCYVTSAEWLDVKYGQALRQLLVNGLGGVDVFVVEPSVRVFPDALVTAAITCFAPGAGHTQLKFQTISREAEFKKLASGKAISMASAKSEQKWSMLLKGGRPARPTGFIELGEIFRVSRGQVTGLNKVWIQGPDTPPLPERFLTPAITDSTDITQAVNATIASFEALRKIVSLPRDISTLSNSDKKAVERFLAWATERGAHETYVALHRKPWWSIQFRAPPPLVMTYMGRRPPVFACNPVGAQLINVAHGLYPHQELSRDRKSVV